MMFPFLFSCAVDAPDPAEEKDPEATEATLLLLGAMDNAPLSGVPVSSDADMEEATTGSDGRATVAVHQSAPYFISAGADLEHVYQGVAGSEPFEVIGYLSDRSTTQSVYGFLGLSMEPSKGILVVAMDYPDLRPVSGASASVSADSDEPFVFGAAMPSAGDTLLQNGASFVSFPNAGTGPASISVEPPEGVECFSFPGGTESNSLDVEVYADTVTVAVFECE